MFYARISSQEIKLEITSKTEIEKKVLSKIDYKKEHIDTTSVYRETQKISSFLKSTGFFTNTIDSIVRKHKNYIAYFSLNDKIDSATITVSKNHLGYFEGFKTKKDSIITIPIVDLQNVLINTSKKLDDEGKSFSKVRLKNLSIIKKTLFADLDIMLSNKRIINKVIVKGYDKFPTSFLKNYFDLERNTIFNQKRLSRISSLSKGLNFAKEIKPPEVLFTKDSTLLYIYLKKRQNNSFDGIVNFASKEDGGVLFNGNIDLQLNNILNTGEKFNLFWNSIDNERQEFKLSTQIPYIFTTKISPEITFTLYRQDSTFLTTKFDSKLLYDINPRLKAGLIYSSESSQDLEESTINNIETFKNNFIGIQLRYNKTNNDNFLNDKLSLMISPSFGTRTSSNQNTRQLKLELSAAYLWDLNLRNSIYIKNKIGILDSNNYLFNELYRIGGPTSIRGYNEQSIFTSNFSYFNVEYRYLTSRSSYLHSITDIGFIKESQNTLIGLGIGYCYLNENFLIKIGIASGINNKSRFTPNNSKLLINWISYF